jgi:hypothetical protein
MGLQVVREVLLAELQAVREVFLSELQAVWKVLPGEVVSSEGGAVAEMRKVWRKGKGRPSVTVSAEVLLLLVVERICSCLLLRCYLCLLLSPFNPRCCCSC